MRILLTGGTGYIGSHTALALIAHGHDVVLLDNLSNSHVDVVKKLERIAGRPIPFVAQDIRETAALQCCIEQHGIEAVIHFAGLKAVGDSVARPLQYYDNNVRGTLSLLEAMTNANVATLVFSSSATVYGEPVYLPLDEGHARSATNPYGRSKLMIEEILADVAAAASDWRIAILRYFNPVGAHESGLIGEDPNGTPNNLMPFIGRVASGRLGKLSVFGGDYDTIDGTGVRDYIHVTDLAEGHVKALTTITQRAAALETWNLGTGHGHSVLEVVHAFERVNGVPIAYQIVGRRPGDIASCYASVSKAKEELGWEAQLGLDDMVASAWRFESLLAT